MTLQLFCRLITNIIAVQTVRKSRNKNNKMFNKVIKIGICIFLMVIGISTHTIGQSYLEREDQWVSSVVQNMTLDQKIGQIFMIRTYSRGNKGEEKIITDYIKKYYVGGICFFQGSPVEQVSLINKFQAAARIPLFIGMDSEWGLGMRFPNETISFPKQLMLGAIQDNNLIYEMGKEVAKQCKRAGININFAPSVDINNNPNNPVIFDRSFGESPQNVTEKGFMYMRAMEEEGVMACIKHFPGHGDTDVDSHYDLPVLTHGLQRLEETEFYPFRKLTSQGVGSLMVGHLNVPALDDRPNRPTTLSSFVIKDLLRDNMGFNGLIFTDAMDMKGVTKYYPNGIAEAEAFLAGNDVILLPENLPKAIATIKSYVEKGKISMDRLNESVTRILRAKYKLGLSALPTHNEDNVLGYLNRNQAIAIKEKLTEAALTLVTDNENTIPIRETEAKSFGTLSINVGKKSVFQSRIDSYVEARHYQLMPQQVSTQAPQLQKTLSQFDKVVVAIHTSGKLNDFSKDINQETIKLLTELNKNGNLIVVLMGSPYLLSKLDKLDNVLLAYDNNEITQDIAAQSLFGANEISGKLPITINEVWTEGHGLYRGNLGRLGYSVPERVQLSSDSLSMIDGIMDEMIRIKAAPGGQVLIAKDGKIVWEKGYGKLKSDGYYVSKNTIYDIASVTKILATTLSVMKLVDKNKINIYNTLGTYISGIDTTNKANLVIRDVMAHHAKLLPWISFYTNTTLPKKGFGFNTKYYSGQMQANYAIPVAKGMFMRTDYQDTMWQQIWTSSLRNVDGYRYSDLGFYIMQKIVENESGEKLNDFAFNNFYGPLGLRNTRFKPLEKHLMSNIAPSEIDDYFRYQTLQGNVHDMGAAMMGGVAGHAGLFSTAHDMAVIMQMLLNKGSYGGSQYFRPETVDLFTNRFEMSTRRGIGFDMKELDNSKTENMSPLAPAATFGHLGFTGIAAFADPENKVVFIMNTNRTYPNSNTNVLNNKEFRPRVQSTIYKAMQGYAIQSYL